ncbi:membrane-bound PQQ-dependent dehydrogenase, glucose/quinate/shikimate family [Sphingopyxis sp.]|uniref:membrane-bound PQQ-dependent dehydrogenase, glucose/quinate/shikimate family n=1 Tax=Sphingopyxis sp. TaxID=1908224 RepID=UPI002D78BB1B|nr:membrane-bound PQQ-dependent dehydrogenase, glucose/quinate/shikimate family [Sphingopyxis sp.]HET6525155.1 membrane-bound PQQ-dependent dehydrogenase, glucose/quinate/shikimate family [Sphingopyxis sp.]
MTLAGSRDDRSLAIRIGALAGTLLVVALGLAMLVGGIALLRLGGTFYYALAGVLLLFAGWLRHRRDPRGRMIYAAFLFLTLLWSAWETRGNPWGLLPRLPVPLLLGLLFLPQRVSRLLSRRPIRSGAAAAIAIGCTLLALVLWPETRAPGGPTVAGGRATAADAGWAHFGGSLAGTRFSPADAITPANVADLKIAWTWRVGTVNEIGKGGLQATPIRVGDALYLCTGVNDIVALDAETGRQLWRHDANVDLTGVKSAGCRGVAYYKVPGMTGDCSERIITNTVDARLLAVDRRSGRRCADFGRNGEVSLLKGMGVRIPGYYYPTSAPTIARGRIIVGGWVTDNQYWGEPSGVIRAFDARTGRFLWAFDVGRPDDHGEPAEGQTYTLSTPNSWGPMSADETLGLVYAPLGNPTPDYYGRQRRPFDEKYGTSVVAIDLETGASRWVFQTVHHDLWDYDTPAQPTLIDIDIAGRPRKALLQPTKRGEIFLLDRETGKPIAPVKERPVPQHGIVDGERLSPTQPFSAIASLAGPPLSEAAMWGLTPLDQLWCRIKFREARYDGIFTPPGLTPSITYPGYLGGTNWGGLTVDARTGRLIVNMSHVPNYTQLIARREADAMGVEPVRPGGKGSFAVMAQMGTPYAVTNHPFLSPLGVPCNQPPFGRIASIDIRTGKIMWAETLGTTRDAGPWGIASHVPLPTGMPNTGGPTSTAGGLTFVGATQDRAIRAFESATGRQLWTARLPAGGQATPMTYISPRSGRQFVVISAGGNKLLGSKLGDTVVAFALPEQ